MNTDESLYNYLSTHSGLSALVSKRVYPVKMPQDVTLPAVTYFKVSNPGIHAMGTDPNIHSPRYQVSAWGATFSSANDVATQIKAALQSYSSAAMGGTGGVKVQRSYFENESQYYDNVGECYHIPIDFIIWHE